MSRLDGIIRLKKLELDQHRRVLVELGEQRDAIVQFIENIDAEFEQQKQLATGEVATFAMGGYMQGYKLKRDMALQKLEEKDQEILDQQDVVADGFRELKNYEVAQERERQREKKKQAKHEQDAFDELGLQRSQREDDDPIKS